MAYQIPRDGIANNSISSNKLQDGSVTTNKIGDSQVTLVKLASDAKKYGSFSGTPVNTNVTLTVAQVNQFVYLGHNGSNNYTVTIPDASSVNDGDWFTFVGTDEFTDNSYANINRDKATIQVSGGGGINAFPNTTSLEIDEAYSVVSIVSYEDAWIIYSRTSGTRFNSGDDISVQDFEVQRDYRFISATNGTGDTVSTEANGYYRADGNATFTLPSNQNDGDKVTISLQGDSTDSVLVERNGNEINGIAQDMTVDIPWVTVTFRWTGSGSVNQWRVS